MRLLNVYVLSVVGNSNIFIKTRVNVSPLKELERSLLWHSCLTEEVLYVMAIKERPTPPAHCFHCDILTSDCEPNTGAPRDANSSHDENVKKIRLFLSSFQGSDGFSSIGSNTLFLSHQSI
jgi:hypothetical protein